MSREAWGDEGADYGAFDAAIDAGWINPEDLSKAMLDVMNERTRQETEEHFDPAGDDGYVRGQLAQAAICYAMNAVVHAELRAAGKTKEEIDAAAARASTPKIWPWATKWWKPRDARRNLIRAAALLVAEIERLDRISNA